jgi:gamma-glutamylcyclotransferase (GGCT)/AIG2-like uncharacterized protein YtfP
MHGPAHGAAGDEPARLFVYGTLRAGEDNPMAALLRRHARHLGTGTVCGRLYAVDWYPGMTPSPSPDECVTGDLFELDPAAAAGVLAELDAYEGDTFRRQAVTVSLPGETRVSASAYLFAGSVVGLPRVAGGDWLRRGEAPRPGPESSPSAGLAPPGRRG